MDVNQKPVEALERIKELTAKFFRANDKSPKAAAAALMGIEMVATACLLSMQEESLTENPRKAVEEAFKSHGYAQGTKEGIAFNRGVRFAERHHGIVKGE